LWQLGLAITGQNGPHWRPYAARRSKADQIQNLVTFFVREWEKAGELPTYVLSKEKIDAFLAR